jgi:hypothetical protein
MGYLSGPELAELNQADPLVAALVYAGAGWPVMPVAGMIAGRCACMRRGDCRAPGQASPCQGRYHRGHRRRRPGEPVVATLAVGRGRVGHRGPLGPGRRRRRRRPRGTGHPRGSQGGPRSHAHLGERRWRPAPVLPPPRRGRRQHQRPAARPRDHTGDRSARRRRLCRRSSVGASQRRALRMARRRPRAGPHAGMAGRHGRPPPGAAPRPAPPRRWVRGGGPPSETARVATVPVGVGVRNDTLNRAAFALGTLVGSGALSRDEVEASLAHAAASAGIPEREARRTIASGVDAGMHRPRSLTGPAQRPPGPPAGRARVQAPAPWRPPTPRRGPAL